MLEFAPHPLLHPVAFVATFPSPIGELAAPEEVRDVLAPGALAHASEGLLGVPPLAPDARETLRQDVRDLLRHGGYKPTGRGKPSSEYLVRASEGDGLPTINVAVDCCNAISLLSGLPVSVVDLDRAAAPLRVDVVEEGSYVFNASGQEIRLDGLLCLFDANGPCANAVKDSHATKTHPGTTRTLSVLWAPASHSEHADATLAAYESLVARSGSARIERLA